MLRIRIESAAEALIQTNGKVILFGSPLMPHAEPLRGHADAFAEVLG